MLLRARSNSVNELEKGKKEGKCCILMTCMVELIMFITLGCACFINKEVFNSPIQHPSEFLDFLMTWLGLLIAIVSGISSIFGIIAVYYKKLFVSIQILVR